MNMAGITVADRKVAVAALERAKETGGPAAAMELDDGRIITGKTTNLLGASAALLLNVLKDWPASTTNCTSFPRSPSSRSRN